MHAILWRRLDVPGHDACRLTRYAHGWRLEGTAIFIHHGKPARLHYFIDANTGFHSLYGDVSGWINDRTLTLNIRRGDDGAWLVNGEVAAETAGCVDLDLGFTPATNLFALRRLALKVGEAADAPAAWLDDETWTLRALPQRYERRTKSSYWYESPTAGYAEMLEVSRVGFVTRYTGLWEAE